MGTKLAQAAGVPLVPIALQTDFVGLGRWIKDLGPINPSRPVRFAAGPLLAPDVPARSLHQQCLDFMTGQFRAWGVPVMEETGEHSTPKGSVNPDVDMGC